MVPEKKFLMVLKAEYYKKNETQNFSIKMMQKGFKWN